MPIPQKMNVGTDHQYYVQGQKVVIGAQLALDAGTPMKIWITNEQNVTIWSKDCPYPYNHGAYQTEEPPINIFTSKPPYYVAWASSDNVKGYAKFAYY